MKAPSETVLRALATLDANPGIRPKRFAHLMWPDSPAWRHSVKCGPNGSHRGGGMYMAAGGYLGRLRKAGLAEWHFSGDWVSNRTGWFITRAGRRLLESLTGSPEHGTLLDRKQS